MLFCPPSVMVDATISGKYRLLRLLGEGGMGAVYEAEVLPEAPGAGTRVAIKLMQPDLLHNGGPPSMARFHREARAASAVDTEHIVRVLDFGTDPDTETPYMVMELLHGEDLAQLLERVGRLRPEVALRIGAQVCVALEKAHEARVIHRDIKPANLFLAKVGAGDIVVKILDFGLAKIKPGPGELTTALTRPGSLLASPRYMSPEQARGARGIDFRTDLWSLGMVLYHALSGHPAHHKAMTLGELVLSLCTVPPELAEDIPAEVAGVVQRALALDPEDRFPSATAMLQALQQLLPGGWALDEGMLRAPSLGGSPRTSTGVEAGLVETHVAPRLDVTELVKTTRRR